MLNRILLIFFLTITGFPCLAQIRLPRLVRDSMVLQRDVPVKIWGWARGKEKVKVEIKPAQSQSNGGRTYTVISNEKGEWHVLLPPLQAGGPYSIKLTASNEITLNNILIGDVWLCAGQSNMVHQLALHSERYADEIKAANNPNIRQFWIPPTSNLQQPATDLPAGYWKSASGNDVLQFSAVAYFFAKKIFEKYGVPIGLINASVGGTPIEAWTSEEGLKDFAGLLKTITRNKDTSYVNSINRASALSNAGRPGTQDKGMGSTPWFDVHYAPGKWNSIIVPGYWEDQGIRNLDGIVWYRKEVDLPLSMSGVPARISLGRIVDADEVYVNGKLVGSTSYQYPQRRYDIPTGILRPGKNLLVVRVTNHGGKGGFVPDKPYYLAAGNDTVDLRGEWRYKVGDAFVPYRALPGISPQNQPAALFNGMVAPFTNYAIKGVLWYQGESNISNASEYEKLLPALIADWRRQWNQPTLPFLFVQLPNFDDVQYLPSESPWAVLREAQRKTLKIPHTGMAVAIDLGEWNDIHPGKKKEVGERLALAARDVAYKEKYVVSTGPLLKSATREGSAVILSFMHTGQGLTTKDGNELQHFAVAGHDQKYVWAKAVIRGENVVVSAEKIKEPVFVRYAWADNPTFANLYNREGLPASPFQAQVALNPAQSSASWNGKRAAVVLTYDDGLNVHLSHAIPALDAAGLKGTFYISDYFNGLKAQIPGWRAAALNGHELANHTIWHACEGGRVGREFVKASYDLRYYTVQRAVDEIRAMNNLLAAIDGKSKRTFAFPCGDTRIHDTAYIDGLKTEFSAARGVQPEMLPVDKIDLYNIPAYMIHNHTGEQMINLVKQAMEKNALVVFLFHGVGGEHSLNVSLEAHRQLLQYLKDNKDEVWTGTMVEVADFIKDRYK